MVKVASVCLLLLSLTPTQSPPKYSTSGPLSTIRPTKKAASCGFIGRLHYFILRRLAVNLRWVSLPSPSKTLGISFLFYIYFVAKKYVRHHEVTWRSVRGSTLSWKKRVECLACRGVANHLSTITGRRLVLKLLLRWGLGHPFAG